MATYKLKRAINSEKLFATPEKRSLKSKAVSGLITTGTALTGLGIAAHLAKKGLEKQDKDDFSE